MATEAPAVIGAAEKTKQTRAAANAKRATAKERTAQESQKTQQAAHRTRQEEHKTYRQEQVQRERATGQQVNAPEKSGPNLPTIPRSTGNSGHRVIAASWVAGIMVISWQEIKVNKRAPDPKRFVGWSATMGILDLVSVLISAELAGVFAVGLVLGLLFFRGTTASAKPGVPNDNPSNLAANPQTLGTGSATGVPFVYPQTLGTGSATGVPFVNGGGLSSTSPGVGNLYSGGGVVLD